MSQAVSAGTIAGLSITTSLLGVFEKVEAHPRGVKVILAD